MKKISGKLTWNGRLAAAHHESWVGSEGREAMLGESEDSLESSACTRATRVEGEYRSHTQEGRGVRTFG